jgi:SOS response regulatory protein OraA/RecX
VAAVVDYCVTYANLPPEQLDVLDTQMLTIVPSWDMLSPAEKQTYLDNFCSKTPEAAAAVGWPWPFNMVADWLNGLWNWISEAAVSAVSVVSGWVHDAAMQIVQGLSDSALWLIGQIRPLFGPFADFAETVVKWFTATALDFLQDPLGFLSDSFSWVVTQVTGALKPVIDLVNAGVGWVWDNVRPALTGLTDLVNAGVGWVWDNVSRGLGQMWTAISSTVAGVTETIGHGLTDLWSSLSGLAGDLLSGVANALGSGFQAFTSWFIGGIQGLAVTLGNGLKATMDALSGALSPIIIGFVDTLRASFSTGSPDEKIKKAVDGMVAQTQGRLLDELKKTHKSPFNPAMTIAAAATVAGLVLTAQIGVHGAVAAAGIEVLGTRIDLTDVVEGAISTMGLRSVVGAAFALPVHIALLAPLRYAYNQMFRPVIPGLRQADQMYFEGNATLERWKELYSYYGWTDDDMDAWHKTMFVEPNQRTLLTMLADAEIGEDWVRRKLAENGLDAEDIEVMIAYKRRILLQTDKNRLRDNAKSDLTKGYIAEEDLRATLKALGYADDVIEFHVLDAIQDRERKQKDQLLAEYKAGYLKDLVDDVSLETRAGEILVDATAKELYLQAAYVAKYLKPKAVKTAG